MKKFTEDDHKKILGLLKFIAGSRGIRMKDLAYENGLSPSGLYACFYHPSPRTETVVSGLIGLNPQEIWPSRYNSEGLPNRRRRPKDTMQNFEVKGKISDVDEAK